MRWAARVLVFVGALVIGAFAGSFFANEEGTAGPESNIAPPMPVHAFLAPLTTEDLIGTWKGNWGYNDGECTLEITRVEGHRFYGTLRKQGAEIRFEGSFRPETRELYLEETRVVRLGANMGEWSLGKNIGFISRDGRTILGTGYDKWGQYAWAASNTRH